MLAHAACLLAFLPEPLLSAVCTDRLCNLQCPCSCLQTSPAHSSPVVVSASAAKGAIVAARCKLVWGCCSWSRRGCTWCMWRWRWRPSARWAAWAMWSPLWAEPCRTQGHMVEVILPRCSLSPAQPDSTPFPATHSDALVSGVYSPCTDLRIIKPQKPPNLRKHAGGWL